MCKAMQGAKSLLYNRAMPDIFDLRSYLDVLQAHGQLMRITKPVSITHEVADVGATCERQGGPAPLFEHIYDGRRGEAQPRPYAGWQLFSSAVANQERVPLAQGHEMDPANDSKGIGTKIGIDATFDKGRRPYGQRVSYPMVELAKYLS